MVDAILGVLQNKTNRILVITFPVGKTNYNAPYKDGVVGSLFQKIFYLLSTLPSSCERIPFFCHPRLSASCHHLSSSCERILSPSVILPLQRRGE